MESYFFPITFFSLTLNAELARSSWAYFDTSVSPAVTDCQADGLTLKRRLEQPEHVEAEVTSRLSVGQFVVLVAGWPLVVNNPPSTFVPPGDETGDEPQLRRSDLSQDKDPQTAEAPRSANQSARMVRRPTNGRARMVEGARCVPSWQWPARTCPVTGAASHLLLLPGKWATCRHVSCHHHHHHHHTSQQANSPFNPVCFALLNIPNILWASFAL